MLHKLRDFKRMFFVQHFLLTNCWGCGIMEIPVTATVTGAANFQIEKATPFGMAFS
jgi:hypothetical protein